MMFSNIIVRIIEDISDPFLLLDADGGVLFFNDQLLESTGWSSREVITGDAFLKIVGSSIDSLSEPFRVEVPAASGETLGFIATANKIPVDATAYTLIRLRPEVAGENGFRAAYTDLFSNIGHPIYTADLTGNICDSNPAFNGFVGSGTGAVPSHVSDLYDEKTLIRELLEGIVKGEVITHKEVRLKIGAGENRRVSETIWPLRDHDGMVMGFGCCMENITRLKTLEAKLMLSEKNYGVLFDSILSSVILVDEAGRIINLNTAAQELYGYVWEEVSGELFDLVFRTDKSSSSLPKIFSLVDTNNGKHTVKEISRQCKDGSLRYTHALYLSIKDTEGRTVAYSIIERDLTERVNLEQELTESLLDVKDTQAATIIGFAKLTEYRDTDTGEHLTRIREFTRVLATNLRALPDYEDYITDGYIEDLCLSSTLHDIGKVGIEDRILLKPEKLTDAEFERMKDHSKLGGDALGEVDAQLHRRSFLTMGKEIAYYHHERWDGTGYPEGLVAEKIPLSARIVAVADVYDALTHKRPYKKAFPHEKAIEIIESDSGKHFDPDIVSVFMTNSETFQAIARYIEIESDPHGIADIMSN